MNNLGDFLATYGLLAVFAVMLVKEIGIPVPIPSDIVMVTAGIQAATGAYTLLELALALGVAILVGGSIQFFVTRGAGRQVVYRLGRFVGLTPARLDRALAYLQKRGALAVFAGLNIPGARAGIIPAAGLAGLSYAVFAPAMFGGSGVFYGWHVALGYLVGPSAAALLEGLNMPILLAAGGLALLGLGAWLLIRRRRGAAPENDTLDRLHSWTHAACPVCLAATVIQQRRESESGQFSAVSFQQES